MARSRCCCQSTRGVSSRGCPVGLKSCGSMPFAARQTVMSPSSLGLMVLLGSTQAGLPSGSAD